MKRIKWIALPTALFLLCGCAAEQKPTAEPVTAPDAVTAPADTVPVTQPETTPVQPHSFPVETPCGTIYLPDNWDVPITTQTRLGDPMVISFYADGIKLYELTFSAYPEDALGMLQTEDGTVYIGMYMASLEEADDMLQSMQESVNDLLEQLAPEPVPPVPAETAVPEDLMIETAYGTLHYPAKWRDYVMTEQDEDLADFYAVLPERDPVLLFTVAFGTPNGHLSGVLTDADGTKTDIAIVIHDLEFPEDFSDGEKDTVYAMQEEMNYLLNAMAE